MRFDSRRIRSCTKVDKFMWSRIALVAIYKDLRVSNDWSLDKDRNQEKALSHLGSNDFLIKSIINDELSKQSFHYQEEDTKTEKHAVEMYSQ